MGRADIDETVLLTVQAHAKNSSKDLMSLMQINSKFIVKVCTVLCKRITEPTYSSE